MVDEFSGDPSVGVELHDVDLKPSHVAPEIDSYRVHADEHIEQVEFRVRRGRHAQSAGPNNARFTTLAADLVRAHVDVIVAISTPAALAAKSSTSNIPIVFFGVGDPIGTGLVTSLARPGGNVTGVSQATVEGLPGKRLELLKEAAPKVSRFSVMWVTTNPANRVAALSLDTAARTLNITNLSAY